MTTATAAQVEQIFALAAQVDWASVAEAVASDFTDTVADKAAEVSLEALAEKLAPIIAPYVLAAVGANFIPIVGQLIPLLIPLIGVAVFNFQGGDPDPIHDAQTTLSRSGRNG